MVSFTFKKEERLKSRKLIGQLFKEGHSFSSFPLRLVWIKTEVPAEKFPVQMALTVPKRAFAKAAHRNVLRRRIREAYRLHKHSLYEKMGEQEHLYALMFIYVAKESMDYHSIEKAMVKGIQRLLKNIHN